MIPNRHILGKHRLSANGYFPVRGNGYAMSNKNLIADFKRGPSGNFDLYGDLEEKIAPTKSPGGFMEWVLRW